MKNMKMFIVEDEVMLAEALRDKFEKINFTVKIAKDGEEALSLIKSFEPNIIILDLVLPKVDGFEVLKYIKDEDELKRIPIVVLSNLSEDDTIKKALKLGANDYFVKSNHPIKELVEKIKAYAL